MHCHCKCLEREPYGFFTYLMSGTANRIPPNSRKARIRVQTTLNPCATMNASAGLPPSIFTITEDITGYRANSRSRGLMGDITLTTDTDYPSSVVAASDGTNFLVPRAGILKKSVSLRGRLW